MSHAALGPLGVSASPAAATLENVAILAYARGPNLSRHWSAIARGERNKNQPASTSDISRSTQHTARTIARTGLVALSLLVGALAFGGCSDDESGTCNHCCTCNCTGAATCPQSEVIQSDTCLDCDKDCENTCIAASCAYASSTSCDDDTVCPCSCVCTGCPDGAVLNAGAYCAGTCTSCAGPCREACMGLDCTAVDFFTPEPCPP